jgi:hypothetical protein
MTQIPTEEASLAATGETPEIADWAVNQGARQGPAQPALTGDMQAVLPAIKDLAMRVGGLDRLADLIAMLRTAEP